MAGRLAARAVGPSLSAANVDFCDDDGGLGALLSGLRSLYCVCEFALQGLHRVGLARGVAGGATNGRCVASGARTEERGVGALLRAAEAAARPRSLLADALELRQQGRRAMPAKTRLTVSSLKRFTCSHSISDCVPTRERMCVHVALFCFTREAPINSAMGDTNA